ncbi:hypothetical protein OVY48_17665 [Sphingobium sp. SA2]|uniref:hypothetical protein n=1 Tax=Sphingobium sp. SA2 TaxID=1524832 RepID=UPI0028C295EE|nr:hypothetical protein [Sphingobium sp. SA2]MDT7535240.1 hypothetical protein [Sphingobium sp. SA2]
MKNPALIEKLARHLATDAPDDWPARVQDAASILALMKEPDEAMRAVGDAAIWEAMIDAALRERWTVAPPAANESDSGGSDEEGEIRLTSEAVGNDPADWVHIHHEREKQS